MNPPQRRGDHAIKTWTSFLLICSLSFPALGHWEARVYKHFLPILVWFLPSYNMKNAAFEPAEECGLQSVNSFMFASIMIPYLLHKISVWWLESSLAKICRNPNPKIWAPGCSKSSQSGVLFSEFNCINGQIISMNLKGTKDREQVYLLDHQSSFAV